jgi:predicted aspartyl protease
MQRGMQVLRTMIPHDERVAARVMTMKAIQILFAVLLCTDSFAAIVVPIELEKGNPIASARINGIPVRLVVDSGGGVIALKPKLIEKTAAARTGSTRSTTDAYGNKSMQTLFSLDTFELGGSTFSNIEAGEAGKYAAQSPGDGIIGRHFLNRFLAVYDYSSRKITLFSRDERSTAEGECRGTTVRTIPDQDGIIVSTAKTDHEAMRMLWDTGATYSFVKQAFADAHQLPIEKPFYTSQRFTLGEKDFGPLQFVVLDLQEPSNVDGFVGYNFFVNHVVCIDALENEIRIQKN